ncbi:hypothetical protein OG422_31285 (plasmid) [Streptomyces sp. NBC_01525]|uniref:hypothetical protein n=1 Tax=Streptomyces sp. NBC_01525 TaxID=2903893 RepID=UPI002F9103C9
MYPLYRLTDGYTDPDEYGWTLTNDSADAYLQKTHGEFVTNASEKEEADAAIAWANTIIKEPVVWTRVIVDRGHYTFTHYEADALRDRGLDRVRYECDCGVTLSVTAGTAETAEVLAAIRAHTCTAP